MGDTPYTPDDELLLAHQLEEIAVLTNNSSETTYPALFIAHVGDFGNVKMSKYQGESDFGSKQEILLKFFDESKILFSFNSQKSTFRRFDQYLQLTWVWK